MNNLSNVLLENKQEIIRLYNEGIGRIKLARQFNVTMREIRQFINYLIDNNLLDNEAIEEHKRKGGWKTVRVQDNEHNRDWTLSHSKEIIDYFKDNHTKNETMQFFGINEYCLSIAAVKEKFPKAGYPSMVDKLNNLKNNNLISEIDEKIEIRADQIVDSIINKIVKYQKDIENLSQMYIELEAENKKLKDEIKFIREQKAKSERSLSEQVVRLQNILARPD